MARTSITIAQISPVEFYIVAKDEVILAASIYDILITTTNEYVFT